MLHALFNTETIRYIVNLFQLFKLKVSPKDYTSVSQFKTKMKRTKTNTVAVTNTF